jgi:hypothetical protein
LKFSLLKPLYKIKPNFTVMVHGWSPCKIVSDSVALHPR